jgi:hypothetical protein
MNINIQHKIIRDLTRQINQRLNEIFIEGLRRKGFYYDDEEELADFVKENCRCEDHTSKSERIYFVNDIPFLIHYYKANLGMQIDHNGFKTSIEADYGDFAYL